MVVKVLTGYCGDCLYEDISKKTLSDYCNRHGYEFIHRFGECPPNGRHGFWRKQEMIMGHLDSDWILWVDADCIILHPERPLDQYMISDVNMTKEDFLESGSFLLKVNDWTKNFLSKWWDLGDTGVEGFDEWERHNDNLMLIRGLSKGMFDESHFHFFGREFMVKHVHYEDHKDSLIFHVPGTPEEEKLQILNARFDSGNIL